MILRALTHAVCPDHGDCLHRSLPGRVECVACVPAVLAEPPPVTPPTRRHVVRQFNRHGNPGRTASHEMTPAERRVAEAIAAGGTHKDIAKQLGIQRSAVSNAVKRACVRVGAEGVRELVRMVRAGATTPCE